MGVGTGVGIAGIIGAGTSLAGSSLQAGAAQSAASLQAQEQEQALQFQEQEWAQQQQNEAPWLKAGGNAVTTLGNLMGASTTGTPQLSTNAYGSTVQAFNPNNPLQAWQGNFTAPTLQQAENTPGYQFQLQQGLGALNNAAAAAGGLNTGNTGEALQQYGQGLAQTDYNNVYNQALQQYQQSYNQYAQNQANTFNQYSTLAGLGQTAAGQLGSEGQSAASNIGGISLTGGAQIGQDIQNAAAATASGYVGAGNVLGGSLGSLAQYAQLAQLLNGGGYQVGSQYSGAAVPGYGGVG